MKRASILLCLGVLLLASCTPAKHTTSHGSFLARGYGYQLPEEMITQSLFADNASTISEENIKKILNGTFTMPQKLRVAVVKLESRQFRRSGWWWNNEEFLKAQQSYLDLLTEKLTSSPRVETVSVIPEILISSNPTFTSIREAAVRTQADVVAIYTINSEIYSRYRVFSSTQIKAFATTQFILLDVRTGLIPFSATVTKDYESQRIRGADFDDDVARNRVKNEAVLLTLEEIGVKLTDFLNKEER